MSNQDALTSLVELAQRLKQDQSENRSIWSLLTSIHADKAVREQIPLEAVPLKPFYYRSPTGCYLLALLCTWCNERELYPPFACLVWHYPTMDFQQVIDLRQHYQETAETIACDDLADQGYCEAMEKAIQDHRELDGYIRCINIYQAVIDEYIEKSESKCSPEHGAMLSRELLLGLLQDSKRLITDLNLEVLKQGWRSLYRAMHGIHFSVAVVGEFSRGKSSLINHLLDHEALPVGNLPTTAMLTKLVYGPQARILYYPNDGPRECLSLEQSSWEKLTINPLGNSPDGYVEIQLPEAWLQQTGIQLIDTPGAEDLCDKRISQVLDAIAGCDGVVIAVSALMALSLTEKTFIEQHLLSRKVPHIMVVLTRLDQVRVEERSSVIAYVKEKLALWALDIPLYIWQEDTLMGISKYHSLAGIARIKTEIEKWQADSRHANLKILSVSTRLQQLLTSMKAVLLQQQAALDLSADEKLRMEKIQENQVEQAAIRWEDYRLQMLKRSNQCHEWVRKKVIEKQHLIIERLQFELMHANNPKFWWQHDLPYRLKQESLHIAGGLENELRQLFQTDMAWLNEQLTKEFSMMLAVKHQDHVHQPEFAYSKLAEHAIRDTTTLRTFMRLGAGAATIIGYTLFGPFGTAVSIGGGIVTDIWLGKNIDKQKETLKMQIGDIVSRNLEQAMKNFETRVYEMYDQAIDEAVKQERMWFKAQMAAMKRSDATDHGAYRRIAARLMAVEKMLATNNQIISSCEGNFGID